MSNEILTPEEAERTPCTWFGRVVASHHTWVNTVDGYQRCVNCKNVRTVPANA